MKRYFYTLLSLISLVSQFCHANMEEKAKSDLYEIYNFHCQVTYNINEHLPTLKMLSQECSSVVEIGVFNIFTTWALLEGLSESSHENRSYIGIDIVNPPFERLKLAESLANAIGIDFQFWQMNSLAADLENVDLLFIDSLHTYCHLTTELEKFSPYVNKYIALHDTSAPWGNLDDHEYHGDYSEYPIHIDRNKRGLWPAVEDFLNNHPEWCLHARYYNNHGFTILKRKEVKPEPLLRCLDEPFVEVIEQSFEESAQNETNPSELKIEQLIEEVQNVNIQLEYDFDNLDETKENENLTIQIDASLVEEIQSNENLFLEYS